MTKILFVCHGNICRSPMAEFIMKDMVKKAGLDGLVYIHSVAVSHEEDGNDLYPPAQRELDRRGIAWTHRRARIITQRDYEEFDRIYYMDSKNRRYLQRMFTDMGKFAPLLARDVADPWYTGDFAATFDDITEGCRRILEEIQ